MKGLNWLKNKKFAIILMASMIVLSISAAPVTSQDEEEEKILKIGVVGDPENLNPITAYSDVAWSLVNWMYEPLVRWDLSKGSEWEPSPGLADSWEIAENGTTVTFHLNPDAKWHDGVPVTSADVNWTIFTWTYLGYWRASSPHFDHRNITVIDDHTIAFNIVVHGYENIPVFQNSPPWYFLRDWYNGTPVEMSMDSFFLGLPYMPIMPMHLWDDLTWNDPVFGLNGTYYDPFGFYDYWNYDGITWHVFEVDGRPFVDPRIGAGPFKLDSWTAGEKLVFSANKDYHQGAPNFDKIEVVIYSTIETATQAVLNGDVDFAETSVSFAELINFGDEVTEVRTEFMGFEALFVNQYFDHLNGTTKHLSLLEQPVKKAIHQAIDKDRINEIAYLGTANVTDSVIHQSLSWYNDNIQTFNSGATEAMSTLTADGWVKNNNGEWQKLLNGVNETLVFDLKYSSANPVDFSIANLIKEDLAAAGIKINIVPTEPTTFIYDFGRYVWNYDLMVTAYTETGDPTYFNFYVTTNSLINLNGISLPKIDEIYDLQQLEPDDAKRGELIDELQQVLYDDSSIIPLANYHDIEIFRNDRLEFRSDDMHVQSGLFSLYNHYSFLNVKSSSGSGNAPGFTFGGILVSFALGILFLRLKKRK